MPPFTRNSWRLWGWAVFALVLIAHGVLGWDRWGEFNWDSARELITPRRILAGDRSWVDFELIYGPLPYYLTAGLMKWVGTSLWVDRILMAAIVAAIGGCLGWVGMRQLPKSYAPWLLAVWLGAFVFPPVFAFSSCLMLPYSSSGPWSSLWLAVTLALGCAHLRRGGRLTWLLLCLVATTAPFMCKIEIAFGIGAATLALLFWKSKWTATTRGIAFALTGLGVIAVLALLTSSFIPLPDLVDRIHASLFGNPTTSHTISENTPKGLNRFAPGDFPIKATARLALLFLAVMAIARWSEKRSSSAARLAPWLIMLLGFSALVAFWRRDTLFIQAGILLFLAPWLGLGVWMRARSRGESPPREIPWFHLLAILSSARFAVDGHIGPYVFAAPPLLLSLFLTASAAFPALLPSRRSRIAIALPLLAAWLALAGDSLAKYRQPWMELHSPYGSLRASYRTPQAQRQIQIWQEAADWLQAQPKSPGPNYLYSFTPGYSLCFLSGMMPAQYALHSGLWTMTLSNGKLRSPDEEREIEKIRKHQTRFAVVDTTPVWSATLYMTRSLFHEGKIPGVLYFGKDFLPEINAFLQTEFEEVQSWKDPETINDWSYELRILKKR